MDLQEVDRSVTNADASVHHDFAGKGGAVDGIHHTVSLKQAGKDDIEPFGEVGPKNLPGGEMGSGNLVGVGRSILFCQAQVVLVQVGDHQSFGAVQAHYLGQHQTTHALPHDQYGSSLAHLYNLNSVEDTGQDLDQAGIDQRKGWRDDLDIEGPAHDVLCKCAPHIAAGNLVPYSQAF